MAVCSHQYECHVPLCESVCVCVCVRQCLCMYFMCVCVAVGEVRGCERYPTVSERKRKRGGGSLACGIKER